MAKRKNIQLSLFNDKKQAAFGGSLLKSNPKTKRPLSTRDPVHLVLRSLKARGKMSFQRKPSEAKRVFYKTAEKYGIRIYKYANAGNHFHVILRIYQRFLWKAFICELTSRLAALMGAAAGFWTGRPFTRIVFGWGKNFRNAINYVVLNQMEAAGILTSEEIQEVWSG